MENYTVSQITARIKALIESSFKGTVSVVGEISSLSKSSGGHYYFTLKEGNCSLRAVMFRREAAMNRNYVPKNGDSVQAVGEVSVYEPGGQHQLIVRKMDYDSMGLFWKRFEEVKRKLESEGLFDDLKKKSIPDFPARIAVITSETGAAITDFLTTIRKNRARFTLDIWPVPVQGLTAAKDISEAVTKSGTKTDVYDCIVVMRGGGSLDDLAVFNEESIARSIFESDVPVISAVGHERDITICDFVSDKRVATPTAAAELLSIKFKEIDEKINQASGNLVRFLERKYMDSVQQLDHLGKRLTASSPKRIAIGTKSIVNADISKIQSLVKGRIGYEKSRLDGLTAKMKSPEDIVKSKRNMIDKLENRMTVIISRSVSFNQVRLNNAARRIKSPYDSVRQKQNRLENLITRLSSLTDTSLSEKKKRLDKLMLGIDRNSRNLDTRHVKIKLSGLINSLSGSINEKLSENRNELSVLMAKLKAVDHKEILNRGYSIVKSEGKIVKSVKDVNAKDELEINLKDGYIISFVKDRKVSED